MQAVASSSKLTSADHDPTVDDSASIDSEDWDDLVEAEQRELEEKGIFVVGMDEHLGRYTDEELIDLVELLKEGGQRRFIMEHLSTPLLQQKFLHSLNVTLPRSFQAAHNKDELLIPVLKVILTRILRKRDKLPHLNTIDQAVELIRGAKRILVLSGAGISVSCGIPDFRSPHGIYAKLVAEGKYPLDDPQQMFDIDIFREDPGMFYSFASQIYPSNFTPSPTHKWIKALEDRGKLLRDYTQNIDTLETKVGLNNVIQCHGSFAWATCLRCSRKVPGTIIEKEIMSQQIPYCSVCEESSKKRKEEAAELKKKTKKDGSNGNKKKAAWKEGVSSDDEEDYNNFLEMSEKGVMKPDITFFGEKLHDRFGQNLTRDRDEVDLLICIGTSLQVAPVSEVAVHLPHSVPQILINKTPIRHFRQDICLLGECDKIVQYISQRLGWDELIDKETPLVADPERLDDTHYWLFDGAETAPITNQYLRPLNADDDGSSDSGASRTSSIEKRSRSDDQVDERDVKKIRPSKEEEEPGSDDSSLPVLQR